MNCKEFWNRNYSSKFVMKTIKFSAPREFTQVLSAQLLLMNVSGIASSFNVNLGLQLSFLLIKHR